MSSKGESTENLLLDQLFLFQQPYSSVGTMYQADKFQIQDAFFNLNEAPACRYLALDDQTVHNSTFASVLYCISSNQVLLEKLIRYDGASKTVVTLFNNINSDFSELSFEQKYILRNTQNRDPIAFRLICPSKNACNIMDLEAAFTHMFSNFTDYSSAMTTFSPLDFFIMFTGSSRWTLELEEKKTDSFPVIRRLLQQGKMVIASKGNNW